MFVQKGQYEVVKQVLHFPYSIHHKKYTSSRVKINMALMRTGFNSSQSNSKYLIYHLTSVPSIPDQEKFKHALK